jgi:hypothetical protein
MVLLGQLCARMQGTCTLMCAQMTDDWQGYTEEGAVRAGHPDLDIYTSSFRPMRNTLSGSPIRTFMKVRWRGPVRRGLAKPVPAMLGWSDLAQCGPGHVHSCHAVVGQHVVSHCEMLRMATTSF